MEALGDNPGPRRGATLTLWNKDTQGGVSLLLFGGTDEEQRATNESWAFDLKEGAWSELSLRKTPEPRSSHAAAFSEKTNELFIFGGQTQDGMVLQDAFVLKDSELDARMHIKCMFMHIHALLVFVCIYQNVDVYPVHIYKHTLDMESPS